MSKSLRALLVGLVCVLALPLSAQTGTPPSITTQPQPQTVAVGAAATLSVVATGSPAPAYQWRKGGVVIAGATNASYSIANVSVADAGSYDVVLTNSLGTATSSAAVLTVTGASSDGYVFSSTGAGVTITGYTGTGGAVTIPTTLSGAPVKAIAADAFSNKTAISSLTLPGSLVSIGRNAFDRCSGLTSISIPAGVTSIDWGIFRFCTGLTSISVDPANPVYTSTDDGKALLNKDKSVLVQAAPGLTGHYTVPAGITRLNTEAFYGCTGMTGITLPAGLTTIDGYVFGGCSSLTTISIPASVINISHGPFYYCTNLKTVAVDPANPAYQMSPDGKLLLNKAQTSLIQAFGVSGNYSVPSGVVTIQPSAFAAAKALSGIMIPGSVTTISHYAFSGCTGLLAVAIPASVTSVGNYAFDGCSNLQTVCFLGDRPAENPLTFTRSAVSKVYFLSGKSGWSTFYAGVTTAPLDGPVISDQPRSATVSAGAVAMFTVSALDTGDGAPAHQWRKNGAAIAGATSASYSIASVMAADAGSYDVILSNTLGTRTSSSVVLTITGASSDGYVYSSTGAAVTITGYTGTGGAVTIPTTLSGAPVTAIAANAFNGKALTSVVVPNSVTSIGGSAFAYCSTLTSITLPASVTTITSGAFGYCVKLTSITVDAANPSYTSDATGLYNKTKTTLVQVPGATAGTYSVASGVAAIGDWAFWGCTSLTSVNIPGSVTTIGRSAFESCLALTACNIPNGVTSLGSWAFAGCRELTTATIPASVTSIGVDPFGYCVKLASLTVDPASTFFVAESGVLLNKARTSLIQMMGTFSGAYLVPSTVTSISYGAFEGCAELTSISLPASLASLSVEAFRDCAKLTAITVDAANATFSSEAGVLFNKARTTLLQAPATLAGSYSVPAGVTAISDWAFYRCVSLTGITFPNSLVSFGRSAMEGCTGLTSVTFPASVTTLGHYVFWGCSTLSSFTFQGNAPAVGNGVFGSSVTTKAAFYDPSTTGWGATLGGVATFPIGSPFITTHPLHAMVQPGGNVTLSVVAAGSAPLAYQWHRNNTPIAGATAASLALTNVQLAQAGRYHVAVSNAAGTALSAQAEVALTGQLWALGNDSGSFGIGAITGRADYVPAASNVTAVESGGQGFGYFIRSDKTLWGSGTNGSGQLGDGTTVPRSTPMKVADGVVSVAASKQPNEFGHTLFIDTAGAVWGIGGNNAGNLGDGTTAARTTPVKVFTGATAVRAGLGHSLLLKVDGTLWGTGQNTEGQLGLGSTSNSTTWKQIAADVVDFDAGGTHSLYVTSAGVLFAMGGNSKGQLGDGANANRNVPVQIATGVASVAAGLSHSLFVKTDGSLWAMGSNWEGQLGDGTRVDSNVPKQVATGVLRAHGASDYSFFLKSDGTLWSLNTTHDLVASGVVQFSGGRGHHRYVNRAGEMWVNGSDFSGQLGLGRVLAWLSPVRMAAEVGQAAIFHSFSLTTKGDGSQWLTGQPRYWNVSGSTFSQLTTGVARTVAGQVFAIFLKSDGSVYTRGYNSSGVLGAGTNSVVTTPLKIASDAVDVAAGRSHGFFIKTDGSLWGLGLNSSGQLGDGSTTNRSAPVRVAEGVAAVSAGSATTILLKHDGSAWAMGDNSRGQFGVGTTTSATSPVAIGGGFAAVSVGEDHALFLRKDGVLLAAGANGYGQLGDGTTTSRTSAVEVASGVVAISASPLQSAFLKADGSLWAMGRNDSGQLGDGTRTNRSTPVQVAANVVGIARVDGSVSGFIQAVGGSELPLVTTPPSAGARVPGESVLLSVAASGPGPIDYQWRKDGVAILGARGPQLFLAFAQVADSGTYDVVASNRSGSVTSASAVLSVGVAPQVSTQPLSQTSPAPGGSVVFSVAISGTPAPALQWYFNGAPIPGATGATLTLTNVQASAAGVYWVVATNSMGSVKSSPASFSLTQPGNTATQALVGSGYVAGQTLTVTNTLTYTGTASALSWSVLLPAGWSYASSGGSAGEQGPAVGTTNVLDWAWTSVPPSPVTFTYTLNIPMASSGPQELVALGGVRNGASLQFLAQPDPLPVPQMTPHSADTDRNFRIALLELTRVIELYNTRNGTTRTGCYAVATTSTEDGFAPDSARASTAAVTLALHHSADSNRDGKISLLELTRVIELYNYRTGTTRTGDYHVHSGSEDGFNAGPASAHPTL